MVRRGAAGAALGVALVLSLTACDSDDSKKDAKSNTGNAAPVSAVQVLERTSQQAGQADSFKMSADLDSSFTMSGAAQPVTMSMRGNGQARLKPDTAMSVDFTELNVAGQSAGSDARMVLAKDVIYVKASALQALAGGKPWARLGDDGALSTLTSQIAQLDPRNMTKMMTTSKDVREAGKETLDGVETTRYTGTYAPRDALSKLDAETRKDLEQLYQQIGIGKLTFNLWVDGQQLPRKMTTKTEPGAKTQLSATVGLSDYGKPVTVDVPPADQVGDLKLPQLPNN